MKWKKKVKPQVNDFRFVRRFAWLPTQVEGYTVWLETYESTQLLTDKGWFETYRRLLYYYY